MDDEPSDLLQPITLNWRESELKRWTEDYSIDHDASSNFYWLKGRIHISLCDTATICFIGERLPDGNIRLIPWPDDPARYSLAAVAELRRWREALAAAGGMKQRKSKCGPRRWTKQEKIEALKAWGALDRDRFAITLEEWLEERFGATGGQLNVAVSTFYGWRKYLKNS